MKPIEREAKRLGWRADDPLPDRLDEREAVVCLAFISGAEGEVLTQGVARSVDLSPRGVGLVAPRGIRVGRRLRVELLLPSKLRLLSVGQVVHCREVAQSEYRLGVVFDFPPHLITSSSGSVQDQ